MKAIGIMTGTSLDGADIGLIETDGYRNIKYIDHSYKPFPKSLSDKIKHLISNSFTIAQYKNIEKEYTKFCYDSARGLLESYDVDIIGFHGQTLYHAPQDVITHQMGYPKYLQKLSGVEVIFDLRTDDILQGREGAPLVPIFHKAAIKDKTPFAVINIGGVSNVTYICDNKKDENDVINWLQAHKVNNNNNGDQVQSVIAFDMGPGCAPINEIVSIHYGLDYDNHGEIARSGRPDTKIINQLLKDEYFKRPFPKSLDRNHFNYEIMQGLEPRDQVATITYFVAYSIQAAYKLLPKQPNITYLCGGGRNNKFLFELLQKMFHVKHIDSLELNGDMIEAYAFAYLAVRKKLGLYCGTI